MRALQKPGDLGEGIGELLSGAFLSKEERKVLLGMLMEQAISADAASAFITSCDEFAQTVAGTTSAGTPKELRDALNGFADDAHRLLNRINALPQPVREHLHGYASPLIADSPSVAVEWPAGLRSHLQTSGSLLSAVWDAVQALEVIARQASTKIETNKGASSAAAGGQRLAELVVGAYVARFGVTPPGGQNSWFAEFMKRLGDAAGVSCGYKVLGVALKRRS